MSQTDLINVAHVKTLILRRTAELRKGWTCTRVSRSALEDINTKLRLMIDRAIKSHPSVGQTFKEIL